jgi:hypothetical protein
VKELIAASENSVHTFLNLMHMPINSVLVCTRGPETIVYFKVLPCNASITSALAISNLKKHTVLELHVAPAH